MKLPDFDSLYLCTAPVDFRKGMRGLAALIQEELELDPLSKNLFVFLSRDRKKIKALYWDKTGHALWYKVLEKEKFCRVKSYAHGHLEMSNLELEQLLSGLNPWQSPHQELEYKKV
jgi:transposase